MVLLSREAWPALRRLNLSGCKDFPYEAMKHEGFSWGVYALGVWLKNCPVIQDLDISDTTSFGVVFPVLDEFKLYCALAPAPPCLASLSLAGLGLSDFLCLSLADTQMAMLQRTDTSFWGNALLLPGLRSVDLSRNRTGFDTVYLLAGTDPSNSLFPALESLKMQDCRYHLSSFAIPGGRTFGKLHTLDLFTPIVDASVAMVLMMNLSKTTRVVYGDVSAADMAENLRSVIDHSILQMEGAECFQETATVTVVSNHDPRDEPVQFDIPSVGACELRLVLCNGLSGERAVA